MVKRSRSTFESITIVADGREYVIRDLVDWNIINNREELGYSICFECVHGDLWIRCKNEAEQLNIINTLPTI